MSYLFKNNKSATLTEVFMQYLLLKFGTCYLVMINNDNSLKDVFIIMCDCLQISYEVISKRNHKVLTVKYFNLFLNNTNIITAGDCGTITIFLFTGIAAAYTCNSALIDGTNILRSIIIISIKLMFPISFNLNPCPSYIIVRCRVLLNIFDLQNDLVILQLIS